MPDEEIITILHSGAILCKEVAIENAPILFASRSLVDDEDDPDSGWQFLCGGTNHFEAKDIHIWAVYEVLAREPSLMPYLNLPPGTWLTRESPEHGWEVYQRPEED